MQHKLLIDADGFLKVLKDASLYVAKDNDNSAIGHVMLTFTSKQKSVSVIACDGNGYYERSVNMISQKGMKPTLPGKPMSLFIPKDDSIKITKISNAEGILTIIIDESKKLGEAHSVTLIFANGSIYQFTSPSAITVPDYAGIRKQADKGKTSSINLGQTLMPIKELLRAGKVFPVKTGFTIPMYISQAKNGGCLTLLEYSTEDVDMRVIFMLSLPQAA